MIIIHLTNGGQVEVPGGERGEFSRLTKHTSQEESFETVLTIYESKDYGAKVLASFKAHEVLGFTNTDDNTEKEE